MAGGDPVTSVEAAELPAPDEEADCQIAAIPNVAEANDYMKG